MNLREVPTNAFDMILSRSRVTMPRRREVDVISSYPVNTFDTILLSPKIDKKDILKKLRDRELGKIAHFPILKKGKGREEGYEEEKCGGARGHEEGPTAREPEGVINLTVADFHTTRAVAEEFNDTLNILTVRVEEMKQQIRRGIFSGRIYNNYYKPTIRKAELRLRRLYSLAGSIYTREAGFEEAFHTTIGARIRRDLDAIIDWTSRMSVALDEYLTILNIISSRLRDLLTAIDEGRDEATIEGMITDLDRLFSDTDIYSTDLNFQHATEENAELDRLSEMFSNVVGRWDSRPREVGQGRPRRGGVRDEGLTDTEAISDEEEEDEEEEEDIFDDDLLNDIHNELLEVETTLAQMVNNEEVEGEDVTYHHLPRQMQRNLLDDAREEYRSILERYPNILGNDDIEGHVNNDGVPVGDQIIDARDSIVQMLAELEAFVNPRRRGRGRKTKKSKIGRLVILDGKN